jgi:hypothetical protein
MSAYGEKQTSETLFLASQNKRGSEEQFSPECERELTCAFPR